MSRSSAQTETQTVEAYLSSRRADVDAALERLLPTAPDCPPLIAEAMRYSLFAGGKRFRPILTLAAADVIGRVSQHEITMLAQPAACAV